MSGSTTQADTAYVDDAERGRVLRFWKTGGTDPARYILGDASNSDWNPGGTAWGDATGRAHYALWVRSAAAGDVWLDVLVRTDDGLGNLTPRRVIMTMAGSVPGATGKTGSNVIYYLGSAMNDNEWHYVEADLNAIVDAEYPGHTVARVDGIMALCDDLFLDDIVLGGGRLKCSRQVIPGAALGGVLGSWTGPNVVAENGVAARYFHYNDLGTVLAQTKADGSLEGAWEPDHFGNYEGRYAYAGSPARPELGLTGKIWDEAAGAYYFGYRWLDPERGRWLSEEPFAFDRPNLYAFGFGFVLNGFDPNGLNWFDSVVDAVDWVLGWPGRAWADRVDRNRCQEDVERNEAYWKQRYYETDPNDAKSGRIGQAYEDAKKERERNQWGEDPCLYDSIADRDANGDAGYATSLVQDGGTMLTIGSGLVGSRGASSSLRHNPNVPSAPVPPRVPHCARITRPELGL